MWTYLALLSSSLAFYLPGIAPKDYAKDDVVTLLVNRLTPGYLEDSQQKSTLFSLNYYEPGLGFCAPAGGPEAVRESLGSILFGDRIYTSPYQFKVLEDVQCQEVCTTRYQNQTLDMIVPAISYGYSNHWTIDGLPVADAYHTVDGENVVFDNIVLGDINFGSDGQFNDVTLNNYFEFEIEYHELKDGKVRIVGANVVPHSRNNRPGKCDAKNPLYVHRISQEIEFVDAVFSYSVRWTKSDTVWATRWDKYLHVYEPNINWFALINSSVVVIFLVLLTSLVLTRMMRKDFANYNEVDLSEETSDDMGWKLVHGDVFRAPKNQMVYAIFTGTGAQVSFSVFTTTVVAMLGLISPATRGWFSTSLLMFACLGGAIGGYCSAACYKVWGGEFWKINLVMTPFYVPAAVFGMFLLIDASMIAQKASGAVPFGSIVAIVSIWVLITAPLSVLFGLFAFKKQIPEPPVRVNQIPRQVPPQPWYLHIVLVTLLGGFFGFLSIGVQMFYIFSAIWFQKLYYMFGFLFTSLFTMVLSSTVYNALVLYLTLKHENYHWQWRSFFVTGSPAIYLYIYSIVYMVKYMHLDSIQSKAIYIAFSSMGCALAYLAMGFFGIVSSYVLVFKMYSRIKMD